MKKHFFISAILSFCLLGAMAQPSFPATTPPVRNTTDVISLFSDAYTNVAGTNWFPNWGQTTVVTDYTLFGNVMKKYVNLNYQGVQFASTVDASSMTNLHVDIWTNNCPTFDVYLINTNPPNPALVERKVTLSPSQTGWSSFDIALTQYAPVAMGSLQQIKLVGTPSGGTVYLDNIYFWKSASSPTITGFNVPSAVLGDAPFTLTQPTSNSTGAFTYTSSNPAVATVSGNVVTIVGVGTSVITANQAAAGSYSTGSVSANLVVGYPGPTTPAPTPTRSASDVISLFSNAYTDVPVDTWSASWDQADLADIQIAGNDTKKYSNLLYSGTEFTTTTVDATSMQNLHLDIWTPDATTFHVKLVDFGANGVYGGGDDTEHELTYTPGLNNWVSYDIPLTDFLGLTSRAHLAQMIFVSSTSTVYVDNVYFWKSSNAPTITNFSIPPKTLGDAPFTITAPTSNSTGAFTYTSSNPAVATISGNTITVVGIGTTVITATQAAAAPYSSGTITATLVVGSPMPMTPAPTPTRPAADVISLFSNAYTNVPVDTWSAVWDQADVADIQILGNDTKKYTNLVFSGIEFTTTTVNASAMQNYHIDLWTPDATTFHIKLVDFGADGVYGGGDDTEHELTYTPSLSGWVSYDIPLTDFTGLTNRAHLAQMIFVSSTSTVYIDNVYFWRSSNAPTITGFSIPAQTLGVSPFNITPPTSNSTGAITYTSSNTSVATVSGSVITVVGVGTAIITATQAPSAPYTEGTATTTLVVGYPGPTVAAPTPTQLQANVISLFSNAYFNRPVDTWSATWDNADVADILVAGNSTKKYSNLVFAGVEFTSIPLNATNYQTFHVDVWTPDATTFHVKLVDFGANAVFGGGDDTEHELTFTPTQNNWVSYDIPLSDFTGLTARAHLAQLIFVSSNSTVYMDNVYFWKPAGTVPVTLVDFTATKSGKSALLNWKTLNEVNSRGFAIERSTNGNAWTQLQFVNSNLSSSVSKEYSAIDRNPVNGVNYYRLKQVDVDGKQTLSSIATVKFNSSDLMEFAFYPNPAKNYINVSLNTINADKARIDLIDVKGSIVFTSTYAKSEQGATKKISLNNLPKGIYVIRFTDGEIMKTNKIAID
jgi:Secretion system C-terminal sorting domain